MRMINSTRIVTIQPRPAWHGQPARRCLRRRLGPARGFGSHGHPAQAARPSIYSRFARGLAAREGKRTLYFDLDDAFFPAGATTRAVELRVVYLDRGNGSWRLAYHAAGGMKTAATIANQNTGEWRERTFAVADGAFANGGPRQSDLVLAHVEGEDTIFHLIEVFRR